MPVRCLTATPCTIEPRPSLIFAAWAITVHAFSALSCNIDKTLFLGNNAPQSPRSSFDRISSLNCFKTRSEITQMPLCLSKSLILVKNDVFALCFTLFLFFVIFAEKVRFLRQKRTFSLTFLCMLRFAKNGAQTRRFCLFMPFCLCLRRSLQ